VAIDWYDTITKFMKSKNKTRTIKMSNANVASVTRVRLMNRHEGVVFTQKKDTLVLSKP